VRHPATDRVLSLKWKAAPEGLERRNNTPRREIAADRIQRWFLDPEDFVVPPTVGACLPLDVYAAVDPEAVPNVDGANCVFGTLSAWLSGVETPDEILDPVRFERDETYARNLGRYNLLTLLIDNRDTRPANVLVSADSDRRVFSIDNGVSFGEPIFNPFRSHWRVLRVPALPREAIDRLREVGEDELRSLAVVAEFRVDDEGLRASEPSRPFAVQKGVRRRGDVLQLGLEPEEIRGVAERLRNLLAAVDAKEIATF
jgi:hypothetical protein